MNLASSIALATFLSMTVACTASTEPPTDHQGAQSSTVSGDPSDPSATPTETPPPAPAPAPAPACTPIAASNGSANPASVYCAALGNTLQGEQCAFADGTACEQWAFYRGECGQAHSFCNLHGGSVANKTEDMGGWTASYALCTMPDGKQCHEDAFAQSCACE
jgi:putative hemolysin